MEREYRVPRDMDTRFLECRALGHLWEEMNPPEPRAGTKAVGHFLFSSFCERCGKERHDAWHRKTGEMVSRRYTQPEGYHTISRDYKNPDIRLELISRWS